MIRIVVTGANGFVGRHVVQAAAARGWEAVGIVRHGEGARIVREAGGRPRLMPGLEAEPLAAAFEGARAVVHLAQIGAERGVATYEGVNLGGVRAVLEAMRRAGVPRIVFLSGLGVAHYGMTERCTNRYFLSKLTCEVELFRSDRESVVFRPSYILGPGGELIRGLLREMAEGEVERVGDGRYRLQPILVRDAAALILAAAEREGRHPAAYDLVGPEPLTYASFLDRVAAVARKHGKGGAYRVREIAAAEAARQAAAGGYREMLPDQLDCLLCDEVSDPRPLEALLGGFLTPLDDALAAAIRAGLTSRSRF